MSGKYNRSKRSGSKGMISRRASRNKKKHDKRVDPAKRELMRAFYFANV